MLKPQMEDITGMNELRQHLSELHETLQAAMDSTRKIALLIRDNPSLGTALAQENSRLGTFGDYITGQLFTLGSMENDVRRWRERLDKSQRPPTKTDDSLKT